ncbi:MAG: enoyl-CoA hydratase/isomerase family protein, partial [Sinobacterium sp.]|nr:enoyl-CoA hydratase/isomerase family protein [Sinobacterium sp.]
MTKPFITTIENGIAEVIFNAPPVNAFTSQGWADIASEIEALGTNDDCRVIIIAAEGRGFCAGVDIKELDANDSLIVKVNKGNYDTFKAIHLNDKPVIVAVHGFVLGGGIGISGAADIIVASECATFAVPEVDRGAMGGGAHLQR